MKTQSLSSFLAYYLSLLNSLRWMLYALFNFLLSDLFPRILNISAKELNSTSGGVWQKALIIII